MKQKLTDVDEFDELGQMFARIKFAMPGWTVTLRRRREDFLWGVELTEIVVKAHVPDSRNPGKQIEIMSVRQLNPDAPVEHLPGFVFHVISDLADHELREWFRVDGELVYDPHKKGVTP